MAHFFILVNGAIALSYILMRSILYLPSIKNYLSYWQQLRFARTCFLVSIFLFTLMPYCKNLQPMQIDEGTFRPAFQQASSILKHSQAIVRTELENTQHMPLRLSLGSLLTLLWAAGACVFLISYVRTIAYLNKIKDSTFCHHKINNTFILFSHHHTTPFCWSWLNQNIIVLPFLLLERATDRYLAIRHELQHVRQGDTNWLHVLNIMQIFCYLNPFLHLWKKYFNNLQEFACDEEIILQRKTSPLLYAECLVNTVKQTMRSSQFNQGVIAIHGMSKSTLYRRVDMLFNYKHQPRKFSLIAAYLIGFSLLSSAAFALQNTAITAAVTPGEINAVIKRDHLDAFQVSATPEVIAEINHIRSSEKGQQYFGAGLIRMKQYQASIQQQLTKNSMPYDLIAMPLMQSGFQPLDESKNHVKAAGIWQIIPSTARNLGLTVDAKHDDRLDTERSTQAALTYLTQLHAEFHDWKLAVIGYELGEKATEQLIKTTGSRDPWVLARSPAAPKELKDYLAMYDATVIIIHKPSLITG